MQSPPLKNPERIVPAVVDEEDPAPPLPPASPQQRKESSNRSFFSSLSMHSRRSKEDRPLSPPSIPTPPPSVQLPEELRFLLAAQCNPNLRDPQVRKIGLMRQAAARAQTSTTQVHKGNGFGRRIESLQNIVGIIMKSTPVQTVMILVIMLDCVLTVMSLSSNILEEATSFRDVVNWTVLCFLTADVSGRFFSEGRPFLYAYLNILELILVPVTLIELVALQDIDAPLPLLRALRPVLRGLRIVRVLVRTAGKGASYVSYLRRQISGERVRFTQDGFDLDLAYITGQIIAMSVPGFGYERLLHNPYSDVACFLNERHGNKYLLVNTTEERRYPVKPFFGRYYHFPIAYQGVPSLQEFYCLAERLDAFLRADPEHVLAIHSRHGQGRASMVVIALLLFRGTCPTVGSCIAFVEHNRTNQNSDMESTTQTLDNTSQRRFLEYFGQVYSTNPGKPAKEVKVNARPARLVKVTLHGLPGTTSTLDVKCFLHDTAGESTASTTTAQMAPEELEDGEENAPQKKSLAERVKSIIAESTLDSLQAGCRPRTGRPVFAQATDKNESSSNGNGVRLPPSPFEPDVWTVNHELPFQGEFLLEFHRRPLDGGKAMIRQSQQERMKHHGRQCLRCFRRKKRRASSHEKLTQLHGGMLFGCWLHAGFLEYDEPHDLVPEKPQQVTISLDRFSLDKAANAPTMRSYSSVLKVQLDFEVDERIAWTVVDEDEAQGLREETFTPVLASANMSETYTLEWLTWVSKRVWPSFTMGFEQLIRNNLMPSLKDSMPGPLRNIRLAQCSFGHSYPHFGPISACSRKVDGLEVQLDIHLNYSSAVNIVLDAGLVSFGISHLKLSGMLSLRFKPILAELPVFSAMQLLFLNLPEVDLRFARNLEIANSSRVRNLIFGAINKALCDLMVLPNIININWADPSDDGSVSFRNVLPCAILRLRVIEARDLHLENSMFKRAPDTFVKVQLGAQVAQTPIVSKNANPVFGTEFDLLVYDEQQHIAATVMDVDYSGRPHTLCSTNRLPVFKMANTGQDGQWHPLSTEGKDGKRSGSLGEVLLGGAVFELVPDPVLLGEYVLTGTTNGSKGRPLTSEPTGETSEEIFSVEDTADNNDQEPQELEQESSRCGSVALLVCEVFGGHCPPDLAAVSSLEVKVSLRQAEQKRRCVDAQKVDPGGVSEKSKRTLERLAALGLDAEAIAESLGEDITDVQRIMRKCGWNLEVPQKFCILLTEADLSGATNIEVVVNLKKRVLGSASVPLNRLMQAPGVKHAEIVACKSPRHRYKIDLDAEFRLFALKSQYIDL